MSSNPENTALHASTCPGDLGCAMSAAGHDLHPMQRVAATATPSSWVDAFVGQVAGGWATLQAADDERVFRVWHHEQLSLTAGEPVALHATYHVLAVGRQWLNVLVDGVR
jgi:hypothetical protein